MFVDIQKIFCIQGLLSEVEVKYKMSECYLHMKEYREATTIVSETKLISCFVTVPKKILLKNTVISFSPSLTAYPIGCRIFDCRGETISIKCQSSNFCQLHVKNIRYVHFPLPSQSSSFSLPLYLSQAFTSFPMAKILSFLYKDL